MNVAEYFALIDERLRENGYGAALCDARAQEVDYVYHAESSFKLSRLNGLDTYFVLKQLSVAAYLDSIRQFIARALGASRDDRVQRHRRKMRAMTTYAVLVGESFPEEVERFIARYPENANQRVVMTSTVPFPILADVASERLIYRTSSPQWGAVAYRSIRSEAARYLGVFGGAPWPQ